MTKRETQRKEFIFIHKLFDKLQIQDLLNQNCRERNWNYSKAGLGKIYWCSLCGSFKFWSCSLSTFWIWWYSLHKSFTFEYDTLYCSKSMDIWLSIAKNYFEFKENWMIPINLWYLHFIIQLRILDK